MSTAASADPLAELRALTGINVTGVLRLKPRGWQINTGARAWPLDTTSELREPIRLNAFRNLINNSRHNHDYPWRALQPLDHADARRAITLLHEIAGQEVAGP